MKIQSYSDIITNSSSELFVFDNGETIEEVVKGLDNIYPGWEKEYELPKYVKDTDDNDLWVVMTNTLAYIKDEEETYTFNKLGIKPYAHVCGRNIYEKPLTEDMFDKNDCYALKIAGILGDKPEKLFKNWETYNPFSDDWDNCELEFTDYCLKKYKKKTAKNVLLWSIDENPDWNYQEKLMAVSRRYHLG